MKDTISKHCPYQTLECTSDARSLANVKLNAKRSWKENLNCRCCDSGEGDVLEEDDSEDETDGYSNQMRFIDLGAPCGGSFNYSGCIVLCYDIMENDFSTLRKNENALVLYTVLRQSLYKIYSFAHLIVDISRYT